MGFLRLRCLTHNDWSGEHTGDSTCVELYAMDNRGDA